MRLPYKIGLLRLYVAYLSLFLVEMLLLRWNIKVIVDNRATEVRGIDSVSGMFKLLIPEATILFGV